jgi:hypothetical protein
MRKSLGQHLRRPFDQLAGFLLVDVGQVAARDFSWLAADPLVRFMGVGVDSVRDELLAVAQEFEFLSLLAFERHRNLGERRVASERNCALGPESGAAEDCAFLLELIADQLFDRLRGVGVIDVDVECGRARSENAGVFCAGIGALPPLDLVLGDTDHLLPFTERRLFAVGRNRVEAGAA